MAALYPLDTDSLNSRKRGRDDDQEDHVFGNGPLSFQQHRSKQKRMDNVPVPLQSSSANMSYPQARSHFSPWTSSPIPSPSQADTYNHEPLPSQENDLDMIGDDHLEPGPMQPDVALSPTNKYPSNALANRMPTPIQPWFANQRHPHMQDRIPITMSSVDSSMVPRSMEDSDWAQTRRLPSPISEGESDFLNSPGMVLDGHFAHQQQQQTEAELREQQFHAMHHERLDQMGGMPAPPSVEVTDGSSMEVDTTTPSPPKKGHTRSRHTLNSWTWKPGMKRSFSIGYRSDCEKCRLKVPGHFNHIVIS